MTKVSELQQLVKGLYCVSFSDVAIFGIEEQGVTIELEKSRVNNLARAVPWLVGC